MDNLISKLNVDVNPGSTVSQSKIDECLNAARELQELGDAAVKPLSDVIHSDGDDDFYARLNAGFILAKLGTPEALDVLVDTQRPGIAGYSTYALLGLGTDAVEALVRGLKSENDTVAFRSAWLLGRIGDERALEPLAEAAARTPYENVRCYAKAAIETIKKKHASNSSVSAS